MRALDLELISENPYHHLPQRASADFQAAAPNCGVPVGMREGLPSRANRFWQPGDLPSLDRKLRVF